jgi:hypothetical protein
MIKLTGIIHQEKHYAVFSIKQHINWENGNPRIHNYAIVHVQTGVVEEVEGVLPNALAYCKAFDQAYQDHIDAGAGVPLSMEAPECTH